jgi:hypothetical protein
MRRLRKLPKFMKTIATNPQVMVAICKYLKNDALSLMGKFDYVNRVLFIAGLPKSGTTWMEMQLAKYPGYNTRLINDPDRCMYDHDVCDSIFASLPKNRYSIVKLHTKYSEKNFETIRKHVPRFVVMIRDLRDMCISRYFHVRNEKVHRHHELYNMESEEAGLMHSIGVIGEEYVSWVSDWVKVCRDNPRDIMLITYEELNRAPEVTFKKVTAFFNLPARADFFEDATRSNLQGEKDLQQEMDKNIAIMRSTKRKGTIGDWKNYFSEAHKNKFKEIAGNLLIELGYERDLNW